MAADSIISILVSAKDEASQALKTVQSGLGSLQGAYTSLGAAAAGITAILGGGKMFKDAIDTTKEVSAEVVKLSKVFGVTAEDASVLRVALDDAFLTVDDAVGASDKLTRAAIKNGEAFKTAGIDIHNGDGSLKDSLSIMMEVNDYLKTLKEGKDRDTAAMALYGKGWREFSGILRLTSDGMEEAKKRADDLHLVFGADKVAAVKQYKTAIKDIGDVTESLKLQIGLGLLPEMTNLAVAFGEAGTKMIGPFISGLHSVEAEVTRMAMLADKAGGSVTSLMYYMTGGKFTDTGKWWADQNKMYEDRYKDNEKRLQKLANLEVGLDENGNQIKPSGVKGSGSGNAPDFSKDAADKEKQFIESWNKMQDKIREMNPAMTDYQKEVQKVNDEYDSLIIKFPEHAKEWEHNRGVMLSWTAAVKQHEDAVKEMADVYELVQQDQAKAYQEMSDVYQLELQDQEKAAQAISDVYQEILMEQEEIYKSSPWEGMQAGLDEYAKKAQNLGDQFKEFAGSTMKSMEDALVDFATGGKATFADFANSIIKNMMRIMIQASINAPLAEGMKGMNFGSLFGGLFGGNPSAGTPSSLAANGTPSSWGSDSWFGPAYAAGTNYVPQTGLALVHQGEKIIPANQNSGGMNVTFNLVNQSGQSVKAKEGATQFDGKNMIKTVILEAMDTDPGFKWAVRGSA